MSTENVSQRTYSFGEFTLDLDRGALLKGGSDIRLRPKSFEVLCYLVERNGQLVSKKELLQSIWANTVVTDDAVTQCLIDIRRAIDDSEHEQIRTIPRRGYILDIPFGVDGEAGTPNATTAPDKRRWLMAALPAILLVAVAIWWATGRVGDSESNVFDSATASSPSIAVLPFADMSPEQDQEYFSDGISEEILNLLTRVPELRVIARTSSFSFKNQPVDIAEIGARLKVSHVLEGSVRKSAERIRITVQLVDAGTSEHLWSETYDRNFGEVLQIQDEISAQVVNRLHGTLLGPDLKSPKIDPEAYVLFLRARSISRSSTDEASRAESLLRQALEIDPDYVQALTTLNLVVFFQTSQTEDTTWLKYRRSEGHELMVEILDRALAIEPLDGVANAYLAYGRFLIDNDSEGLRMVERAVANEPNNSEVLRTSGAFARKLGQWETAIVLGERAIDLDPLCTLCYFDLTNSYLYAGRLSEAEDTARRNIALNNRGWHSLGTALLLKGDAEEALRAFDELESGRIDNWTWRHGRALALHSLGRHEEAQENLGEYVESSGQYLPYFNSPAQLYAWTSDIDAAFNWLDKTWHDDKKFFRYDFLMGPAWDPLYKNLHGDPRWEAYWRAAGATPTDLQAMEIRVNLPELAPPVASP